MCHTSEYPIRNNGNALRRHDLKQFKGVGGGGLEDIKSCFLLSLPIIYSISKSMFNISSEQCIIILGWLA